MKISKSLIFIVLQLVSTLLVASCNGSTGILLQPSETDTEAVITTAAFRDESTAETPATTSVTEVPVPIDIYACEHECSMRPASFRACAGCAMRPTERHSDTVLSITKDTLPPVTRTA